MSTDELGKALSWFFEEFHLKEEAKENSAATVEKEPVSPVSATTNETDKAVSPSVQALMARRSRK